MVHGIDSATAVNGNDSGTASGQPKRTALTERERGQLKFVENVNGLRGHFWNRLLNQNNSCELRDLWEACGYGDLDTISPQWYRSLYDTFSIANRIVRLMPYETWQSPPMVYEDEDSDSITDFEEAWDNLPKDLATGGQTWHLDEEGSVVWQYLKKLDVLSGIGSFGVMLLGIDDGRNLQDPVDGVQVLDPNKKDKPTPLPDTPFKSMKNGKVTDEQRLLNEDVQNGLLEPTMNYADPGAECNRVTHQVRNRVSTKDQYPNVPQNPSRTDPRTTQSFESQNHPDVGGRNPTSAGTGQPPPNQGYSDGTVGSPGAGPFVQGTDQQYERTSGMGMAFPAGAALAGTDQQYFGVQFGPSEEFGAPTKQKRRLLFLRVFDESLVQIVRYEWNIRNPRFGLPVMYRITLNDPRSPHGGVGLPLATVYVHWSRVIHTPADGTEVPSEIFGNSRLKANLEHLLPLRKIYAADGQGYWKNAFNKLVLTTQPTLGGDVDVEGQGPGGKGGVQQLQDDVSLFNDPMTEQALMLIGMDAKTLPPVVTDPTPHCEVHLKAIAMQMDIPYPVLQGYEIGEQASENNQEIWNDRKRGRQMMRNTRITVDFVDRLISIGVLPAPVRQKKESKLNGRTVSGDPDFIQKPLRPPGSQQSAQSAGGDKGGYTGGSWRAEEAAGAELRQSGEAGPGRATPKAAGGDAAAQPRRQGSPEAPVLHSNPEGHNQYTMTGKKALELLRKHGFVASSLAYEISQMRGASVKDIAASMRLAFKDDDLDAEDHKRLIVAAKDIHSHMGNPISNQRHHRVTNSDQHRDARGRYSVEEDAKEATLEALRHSLSTSLAGQLPENEQKELIRLVSRKSPSVSESVRSHSLAVQAHDVLAEAHKTAMRDKSLGEEERRDHRDAVGMHGEASNLHWKAGNNLIAISNQRHHRKIGRMIYACNAEGDIEKDTKGKDKVVGVETEAGYVIEWPEVDALSVKDQAAVCLQMVQADAAYIAGGNDQLVHPKDYLTRYRKFSEEEAEAILQQTQESQQEQQEQAEQQAAKMGLEPIPPEGFQSSEAALPPQIAVGPGEKIHHAEDLKPGSPLVGQKQVPGQGPQISLPGGGDAPQEPFQPRAKQKGAGGKASFQPKAEKKGGKPTLNELTTNSTPSTAEIRDSLGRWIKSTGGPISPNRRTLPLTDHQVFEAGVHADMADDAGLAPNEVGALRKALHNHSQRQGEFTASKALEYLSKAYNTEIDRGRNSIRRSAEGPPELVGDAQHGLGYPYLRYPQKGVKPLELRIGRHRFVVTQAGTAYSHVEHRTMTTPERLFHRTPRHVETQNEGIRGNEIRGWNNLGRVEDIHFRTGVRSAMSDLHSALGGRPTNNTRRLPTLGDLESYS